MLIKKTFILQGLGCANCASKIEKEVRELSFIEDAVVNFVSKKLIVSYDDSAEFLIDKIKEIVSSHEADTKVIEVLKPNAIKRTKKEANFISTIENTSAENFYQEQKSEITKSKVETDYKDDNNHKNDEHKYSNDKKESQEHGHNHQGHGHSHEGDISFKKDIIKILIGAIIFLSAIVLQTQGIIKIALFLVSYMIIGGEILLRALKNILKGQVFDENFLMTIATIGAFAIGEFPEGIAVMLFYQIGELFQDLAVNRSRKSIADLMDIRPDYANLKTDNGIERVSPEEVAINEFIVIRPGEKVPLDGEVVEGASMLDTSALTGESAPRKISIGDTILSGFININGLLTVKVTKEFSDSTVAKILELVENASARKAPTENFITTFARYYTPIVVISAAILAFLPPLFIDGAVFSDWIYRALTFLVISCPCALVISIPLGFFGGIGGASKRGILIKGGNFLEALNHVEVVVFDKTGTLTKGVFRVTDIKPVCNSTNEELHKYTATAESLSNHPIATSIVSSYKGTIEKESIESYEEIVGYGVKAIIEGKEILCGNSKLMRKADIDFVEEESIGTIIYTAIDGAFSGSIKISDEIKEDSKKAIEALKAIGVKETIMLTGDSKNVAEKVAKALGIGKVYSELLPTEKVQLLESVNNSKGKNSKVIFVGDGINDAPVLARADIGIAMGGLGSDAAIEAADVVIMTDEPYKIFEAIKIGKRTRRIVLENIIFALGIKFLVLVLGAFGDATMWQAVFADVGVAILAILNAMRALRIKNI